MCKVASVDDPGPLAASGALAHPTRAQVFDALVALRRPATTVELAAAVDRHPNGVRGHLERLAAAGLVRRERERRPRGRPRDRWSVAPGAPAPERRPVAYRDLAGWLALAFGDEPGDLRRAEAAGRSIGAALAPPAADAPLGDQLAAAFAALGFAPRPEPGSAPRAAALRLCNCPYRDVARARPDLICTLHRGIAAGMAGRLRPGAAVTRFEPQEPDAAGCLVEVVAPASAAGEGR